MSSLSLILWHGLTQWSDIGLRLPYVVWVDALLDEDLRCLWALGVGYVVPLKWIVHWSLRFWVRLLVVFAIVVAMSCGAGSDLMVWVRCLQWLVPMCLGVNGCEEADLSLSCIWCMVSHRNVLGAMIWQN